MALTIRGTTQDGNGATGGTTTRTPGVPSGTQTGDLLIIAGGWNGAPTLTAPTGWTEFDGAFQGNDNLAVYWRSSDGSSADDPTLTLSGSATFIASMVAIGGWNGTAPVHANQLGGANSTTITYPAITPASASDGLVYITGLRTAASSVQVTAVAPAGGTGGTVTIEQDVCSNRSGAVNFEQAILFQQLSAATAIGQETAVVSTSVGSVIEAICVTPSASGSTVALPVAQLAVAALPFALGLTASTEADTYPATYGATYGVPSPGQVTVAAPAPSAGVTLDCSAAVGAVTVTAQQPGVGVLGGPQTVALPTAALASAAYPPTLAVAVPLTPPDAPVLNVTVTALPLGTAQGTRSPLALGATVTDLAALGGTATPALPAYGGTTALATYDATATLATYDATMTEWTMQAVNLTLAEFNDEQLAVNITSGGNPLNITGFEIDAFFKTAAGVADTDPSTIKLSTTGGQITVTSATQGQVTVAIPSSDLANAKIGFWRLDVVNGTLRNTAIYGTVAVTLL